MNNTIRLELPDLLANVADNPTMMAALVEYAKYCHPDMDRIEIFNAGKRLVLVHVAKPKPTRSSGESEVDLTPLVIRPPKVPDGVV